MGARESYKIYQKKLTNQIKTKKKEEIRIINKQISILDNRLRLTQQKTKTNKKNIGKKKRRSPLKSRK